MQVVAAAMARCLRIAEQPRCRGRKVRQRSIPEARLEDPPDQVMAAHAPRRPQASPAGQDDLAAILVELFGQLASGLAAADYQHSAWGQRGRVAVLLGEQLGHPDREVAGSWRYEGSLVAAGGDHDSSCLEPSSRCLELEA